MSARDPAFVVVYVTAPPHEAPDLARALVDERLAACVNIVRSVRSIYRWRGEVCDDEEALLVIKTRAARLRALRARVAELHSYDIPEVLALPIEGGHPAYLAWLEEATAEA